MVHIYINVKPGVLLAQLASFDEAPFTPLSYRKLPPMRALQKDREDAEHWTG